MLSKTKLVLFIGWISIIFFAGCSSKLMKKTSTTAEENPAKKGVSTTSKALKPSGAMDIRCLSGKDERIISVQPVGQGCQVVYTRHTEISPIANSEKSMEYCNNVAEKMRKNLEASRFKCL